MVMVSSEPLGESLRIAAQLWGVAGSIPTPAPPPHPRPILVPPEHSASR